MDCLQVLIQIEYQKTKIANARDELRKIYDDLEDCLDSFDRGLEGLDAGKLEIEIAIDALSEFI